MAAKWSYQNGHFENNANKICVLSDFFLLADSLYIFEKKMQHARNKRPKMAFCGQTYIRARVYIKMIWENNGFLW